MLGNVLSLLRTRKVEYMYFYSVHFECEGDILQRNLSTCICMFKYMHIFLQILVLLLNALLNAYDKAVSDVNSIIAFRGMRKRISL